jgi:hypothetical protein
MGAELFVAICVGDIILLWFGYWMGYQLARQPKTEPTVWVCSIEHKDCDVEAPVRQASSFQPKGAPVPCSLARGHEGQHTTRCGPWELRWPA